MDSMGILKPPVYYLRCMITWPCVSPPTWLLEFSAVPYLVRSGYILLYPDCVKVVKSSLRDNGKIAPSGGLELGYSVGSVVSPIESRKSMNPQR